MTVQLDSVIEQVEQLPTLPTTSVRIIETAANPQASVKDILEVVRYDQNLTGQVLRLCNSAYYGLSRQIGSLREALAYLGAMPLLKLILGTHCGSVVQNAQPGYGLLAGMLWKHSSAAALAAERIGHHANVKKPAVLFTAGLLHDIGKVILSNFLTDTYQQVLDLLTQRPITFHEAEKIVLGYTHTEVGELVARKWQLPEEIVASARHHHRPAEYTENNAAVRESIEIVHLADSLALTMGIALGNDELQYTVDADLAKAYRIDKKTLDRCSIEVLEDLQQLEQLYDTGSVQ